MRYNLSIANKLLGLQHLRSEKVSINDLKMRVKKIDFFFYKKRLQVLYVNNDVQQSFFYLYPL